MQRYFIKNDNKHNDLITITAQNDVHHIRNVMRMTEGSDIVCIDENGQAYQCQINGLSDNEVTASIEEYLDDDAEMPVDVTIIQGLPKKNKLEWIIQKGSELGCHHFKLFQAKRSIAKWDKKKAAHNITRLEKIAEEASEQCGRNQIPDIELLNSIEDFLTHQDLYDVLLFAYEEEAKTDHHTSIANMLKKLDNGMRIGIFIGPEGGFSEDEAQLLKRHGAQSVRLSPRILRTETAPIYALACISYHFEEMGG